MEKTGREVPMLVEYASSPVAVATRIPRFAWGVPVTERGDRQSAYQVLVASSEELVRSGSPDLWNSGRVESSQSVNVTYGGAELRSDQDCFWAVRVWDAEGHDLGLSRVESFGTALLDESDWSARWIGMGDPDEPFSDPAAFQQDRVTPEVATVEPNPAAPLLRTVFRARSGVRRARAFICGLGLFELRLNGTKVGDEVLATPRTDFRKRVLYSTYDITSLIGPGENAVGLILGNGWFNGQRKYWGWQMQWYGSPRAIVQIRIEYEDGSTQQVTSDDSWEGDWSPITSNCIYDGEHYDARLEQDGWDRPGFDDSAWKRARLVSSPGGRLESLPHEPQRVTDTMAPLSVSEPVAGQYVYDLGVNMSGWVVLRVRGGRGGTEVRLRYAEALDGDGTLDTTSQGRALQEDVYIKRGVDDEVHEPRFTYHGFRYVEVSGYPGEPALDAVQGRFVRTAVERTGAFTCSDELINRIHGCTVQSQLCNVQMGVPTDDTQRPERLGWGADAWGTANAALYNVWMPRVYRKWIGDFRDQQDDRGMVGMIAPQAGSEEDLPWSSAFLLIPWWQYVHHGDTEILKENYNAFRRYLGFLHRCGVNEVTTQPAQEVIQRILWRCGRENRFPPDETAGHLQIAQWGDHLATAEGSASRANLPLSMATAFYYLDVATMSLIAGVLGHEDDKRMYASLAEEIRNAFNERFYDRSLGYYDTGIQSAQAWPLAFGLVPNEESDRVFSYFAESVGRRQRRLTTGYAGTRFAICALSAYGRHDLVWKLAKATDYPSWGYMLRGDRTTTCENWDGETGSLNHASLGAAIDEWFYWGLLGIRPDESAPGFEHTFVRPYIPADLKWARGSVGTVRGQIAVSWTQEAGYIDLVVTIPGNSSATVHLGAPSSQISEGGREITDVQDISVIRSDDSSSVVRTGSGTYRFRYQPDDRG